MWPIFWTYRCSDLQPDLAGWRHPLWLGSDDWPGEDIENDSGTYWRRTIVTRIPGRRYLVTAIPIRLRHKEGNTDA